MAYGTLLLVLVFLGFQLMLVCGIFEDIFMVKDKGMDDLLPLSVSPSSAVPVHFKGECVLRCKGENGCKGIFYNENSKTCTMTSYVFLKNGSESSSPGSRYFRSTPLSCPTDGVYVLHEQSGTCFQLNSGSVTWTDARDACNASYGRLAVLDDNGKLEALLNFMNSQPVSNGPYSIGGHRPYAVWNTPWPNGQPDYVWLNGQIVNYTSPLWYQSEPNASSGGENVLVVFRAGNTWYLGNYFHSRSAQYVCEFNLY